MDIDLLRTFLEVRRLGNFHSAAENLHVSQAAISQRIKHLESILNSPLFVRERNNIYPTVAGEQLVSTAELIVETWNQARHDIGQLPTQQAQVSVAIQPGAWEICGKFIFEFFKNKSSELNLQVDQLDDDAITKRVQRQTLDLGLVFNPSSFEALKCNAVFDFDIALHSSNGTKMDQVAAQPNVYIEWGREGNSLYEGIKFQQLPCLQTQNHSIAETYLEAHPGVALLPARPDRGTSNLKLVPQSPRLRRHVYALWHSESTYHGLFSQLGDGSTSD